MGVLLDDGKYQVLENLLTEPGYTASVCMDVDTRNNYKPLIFNIYSDPDCINTFLPLFYNIQKDMCDSFHQLIPGNRCIMAVFNYYQGTRLGEYIKTIPKHDYPARALIVGKLLDAALVLYTMPPVFATAALSPENTIYNKKEETVRFNFIVRPDKSEFVEDKKLTLLVSYIESAFVKNRFLPEKAVDFLKKIRSGEISGYVNICSTWRGISAEAMAQYDAYKKESIFGYAKRSIKRKLKDKKEKKRKKKEYIPS
ncbi:MAG: hypothetical protein LBD23_08840 [Oscillospiraceae bacterium]|jgi:hypothetical protein|nr:hypothetical protein [Oscillospiraceae bacterium]